MSEITTQYGKVRDDGKIQISVIVPLYKVEEYVGELLESFTNQRKGNYSVEYIFVSDGSPDRSSEIVHTWFRTGAHFGKIIEKENGGVSSARNRGLSEATSEWVFFPDSDDFLSPDFFFQAAKVVSKPAYAGVNVVANNLWRYMDATSTQQDTHALRFRFAGKSKVVDLTNSPHYIHLHAASSFFRRSFLEESGISFDSRIHASEDAIFVAQVLVKSQKPLLGINVGSKYYYRKRATGDSAVDTFKSKPETYFDRFELGYLETIAQYVDRALPVPEWLQMLLLYEYRWIFGYELKVQTKESVLGVEGRVRFLELVTKVLQYVDDDSILGYRVTNMSLEIRLLLLTLKNGELPTQPIHVSRLDKARNTMTLEYYTANDSPRESIRVRAKEIVPIAAKTRSLDYFGQTSLFQRILVVPANSWLSMDVNGTRAQLVLDEVQPPKYALTERAIAEKYRRFDLEANAQRRSYTINRTSATDQVNAIKSRAKAEKKTRRALPKMSHEQLRELDSIGVEALRSLAWDQDNSAKYSNAWVFMDRLAQAQDNAEHLYRWVTVNHTEVNAFFVLKRESSDWDRLARDGFRLIEFGSLEHYVLMLNADVQLSSHADYEMFAPIPWKFYIQGVRSWRYVFLQHGIIKDDLSAWLNSKEFDLFVTSTKPEYDSIAGDFTAYKFTSDCVVQTGLPRYDALTAKSQVEEKDILLVVPTWRESLMKPKVSFVGSREFVDDIEQTEFFQSWRALLSSSGLKGLAEARGLEIVLLPHPIMSDLIHRLDLPDHVSVSSYADGDVQKLFARAGLTITDYSSVAFDVRFAGSQVAYFQFDRDSLHGSGHTMREGYFSYEEDGFGPIFSDSDELISTISKLGDDAFLPYASRFEVLQIPADQKSCERVFEATQALFDPIPKV